MSETTDSRNHATIIISRPDEYASASRQYKVFLDREPICLLSTNSSFTQPVVPGSHTISAKIDWFRTSLIRFEIASGEQKSFTVRDVYIGFGLAGLILSFLPGFCIEMYRQDA